MSVVVARTVKELRAALQRLLRERDGDTVGLVPTMGALHSGHEALFRAAQGNSVVAASIFVNPLQFDDAEDYENYPRTLDADVEVLERAGVDLVFAPSVEEMYPGYPDGPLVSVTAGNMGRVLDGASRPGHFDGVTTVVSKLFNIFSSPAQLHAYFGQKDAQQLMIIKRMVADLNIDVEIEPVSTERSLKGLAMSSRNQRMTPEESEAALVLSHVLTELAERAEAGGELHLDRLREEVNSTEGVTLDYLTLVNPATLEVTEQLPALALIAAHVGPVRLIDNMMIPARADSRSSSESQA
ncbi:pantoate--beta-alanine ligase [Brevibacterium sp. Marseille-P9724]|uniref:pantoate--beta-alanine ligase n=1 Tax=Brevibacterium sp. Marseille-P9724 TaxID=2614125 RepID=UPI0012600643|nr:pantoate--beta-alanine ligase [Brevibacterium sp. Marseille-P9724]